MPNVVKGSKQNRMMVVPYRPRQRLLWAFASVVFVSLGSLGGFSFGYYQTLRNQEFVEIDGEEFGAQIENLTGENTELRRQITMLDRSSMMDQKVNETDQQTIRRLQDQLSRLEQDLTYYKNVVSEQTDDTGLTISKWSLVPTSQPSRYRYQLAVRQKDADGDTYLTGHVNVELVGTQDGKITVYSLNEVSEQQEQMDIKLRFKFFQNVEGDLTLPENFLPDHVRIIGIESAPIKKMIDQDFAWLIQD